MAAKPDVDDGPIAAFVVCGTRGDIQPALALALGVCRDLAFSSTHARASSGSDHGSHAAAGAGAGSGAGAGRGEGYRSDAGAGSHILPPEQEFSKSKEKIVINASFLNEFMFYL